MVSTVVYVIFPVLLALGLLRKFREYQWGHCNIKSTLQGKVFLVTGANSGIGKETVRELARKKARVIMACRDLMNARNAIEDIRRTVATGELIPMELDLSSIVSIRAFANDVLRDFPKVHVLINNAGLSVPVKQKEKTVDGFEINFGVNHLGHFLLTSILLERLKDSAPSRVVVVSSLLHEKGEIDFENLNGEKGWSRGGHRFNPGYCNSKLANMYFALELAKKTRDSGVEVCALCPGFTYTGLFRYTSSSFKWYHYAMFAPVALVYMRTALQGAQTVLHCATTEKIESGGFYRDCKPYKSKTVFDPAVAAQLWETSGELVHVQDNEKL